MNFTNQPEVDPRHLTDLTCCLAGQKSKDVRLVKRFGQLTATIYPSPDVSALSDIKRLPAFIRAAMTFLLGPIRPLPTAATVLRVRARTIIPAHESISCQTARRNRATVRRNSSFPIERRRRPGQRESFILRYDETQAFGLLTRQQHRTAIPYGSPFRTLIWGWGRGGSVSTQT